MIALVQRVSSAAVTVDASTTGQIGDGLLIFLGVATGDTTDESAWLAHKCAHLRVFSDADGRMNHSALDVGAEALVVPQFTLCADVASGHRPSFTDAAPPDQAKRLYRHFVEELSAQLDRPVPTGVFGAMMDVSLTNHGPATFWLERSPTDA
ncbi:D-aminoacyl-tRNA deacylase [Salisaeta longa]|uniref:D-aminoacyl-tRNA deacylase n=1 Tax=Salisaeta longa TaxID=503170 RepID=UPI0003B5A642|nr:D-aminoacyl-tRNA deacylase [Salisaeta longa]